MFSWVWVTRWCWGTNEGRWKEKFARLFSPSRILQISPNQANSTILGRACDFSELLQVFCRPGPRHIIWHHHNVHAAKALCNLLVSSMSTAKKVACTNNHHCKRQFCAIAILPFLKKNRFIRQKKAHTHTNIYIHRPMVQYREWRDHLNLQCQLLLKWDRRLSL